MLNLQSSDTCRFSLASDIGFATAHLQVSSEPSEEAKNTLVLISF